MRVYALCGDEGENTKMTKLCPLQQGLRPCVSECAWYDTLNLCCEVKMITDSLNDIAEELGRINDNAAKSEGIHG
jgi:hypothetical protein